jgi:hypothetical protein
LVGSSAVRRVYNDDYKTLPPLDNWFKGVIQGILGGK